MLSSKVLVFIINKFFFFFVVVVAANAEMSPSKASRTKESLVPLATLIGRELRSEKLEKPLLIYGQAALAKKGEDFFLIKTDCERVPGDPSSAFSVFGVKIFSFLL